MFDRLTWNPKQMNGQPCIRGMRLTVRRVVGAVAIYPNREDLFRSYPDLEEADVRRALEFAAAHLADANLADVTLAVPAAKRDMRLIFDQDPPVDAARLLRPAG